MCENLLERAPPQSPYLLSSFHRFKIRDRVYPAISPVDGESVEGMVMNLTDEEIEVLDRYEGSSYHRVSVTVTRSTSTTNLEEEDGEGEEEVFVYVYDQELIGDLYGTWEFEEYQREAEGGWLTSSIPERLGEDSTAIVEDGDEMKG